MWAALTGPQRAYGTVRGGAARFERDVAPFGAFDGPPTPTHWEALAALVGPGGGVVLMGSFEPGSGWTVTREGSGVQMVCESLAAPSGDRPRALSTLLLGSDDVADMIELVAVAQPGPFRTRTHELGRYLGVRDGGELVAMAGERVRIPGYTEVSAVATRPSHRRRGLAGILIRDVAAGIFEDESAPFLHAAAENEGAIRLYTSLGFEVRRTWPFRWLRAPGAST